jgi:16S rRNA (guanine527-N7)-methyltransferase
MRVNTKTFRQVLSGETRRLGIELTDTQLDALSAHYELLVKWNAFVRLVASTDPARAATELFADSIVAAQFVEHIAAETADAAAATRMIEIGAGAGLPSIPSKILLPQWELTCVESNAKNISFLKSLARELRLDGVRIIRGRAERLAHRNDLRGQFDLAFCRAVAPPVVACELAIPFLKVDGSFIAQTGERVEDLRNAADELGAKVITTKGYRLRGMASGRMLARIKKVRPTPPDYPRDAKRARRKPLA